MNKTEKKSPDRSEPVDPDQVESKAISVLSQYLSILPEKRSPEANKLIEFAFKSLNLFSDVVKATNPDILKLFSSRFWYVEAKPSEVIVNCGRNF